VPSVRLGVSRELGLLLSIQSLDEAIV